MTSSCSAIPSRRELARVLTRIDAGDPDVLRHLPSLAIDDADNWILGVTGGPGAGKSTFIDSLVTRLRRDGQRVAVLAVDPSSPRTGGALLGDRIRMVRHVGDADVFIRSLGSRGQLGGLSLAIPGAIRAVIAAGYRWVVLETVGVGQSAVDVARFSDTVLLLTAPGLGDAVQAGKAGINEIADVFVVSKADHDGARETARDLEASIRLAPRAPHDWRPPVVLTSLGDGIAETYEAIARHRAYSLACGQARARRRAHRVSHWRSLYMALLMGDLERAVSSRAGTDLRDQVATGQIDPFQAARDLVHMRAAAEESEDAR
jgi:LAO/AO transport system kinase